MQITRTWFYKQFTNWKKFEFFDIFIKVENFVFQAFSCDISVINIYIYMSWGGFLLISVSKMKDILIIQIDINIQS